MGLGLGELRPIQAMVAARLFQCRRLLVVLPRQFGGKTELGVRLANSMLSIPTTKSALFLAKSRPAGRKAAREKFMRIFDKTLFEVNTETVYLKKFPTSCCFIDSVDKDPDRIRGGTFSFIHWCEVAFSKLEGGVTIMDVFDRVINPTMALTNGYAYLESTCNGKNGWYDLWENAADFGFSRIRVTLSDMVYLGLLAAEDYDQIQKTTHPDVFRQEYECEWITFQGKTYPEFVARHIDPDLPGPEDWQTVIMGIDWGYSPSATCVLFGYVKDGMICIFDEHYKTEELAIHTAESIRGKIAQWRVRNFAAVADHEADRNEELNRRGIACSPAQKVDVLGNRVQIKELFFQDRIRVHPRCEYLIKDLQAAVWDQKKADKGEIDYGQCSWGHFDAEAAFRYLVRELSEANELKPLVIPMADTDQASAHAWVMNEQRKNQWQ